MQFLNSLLLVVQILSALAMIGLVLIQHGKGADAGASFGGGGGGASGSLFGATGSANFLSRTTAVLAAVFFGVTLALAYLGNPESSSRAPGSVLERAPAAASAATPADAIPGVLPAASTPAAAAPAAAPASR